VSADAAARSIDALPPIPVVVLLGGRAPPAAIRALLAHGVRGLLPDASSAEEIAAAIEAAAAGLVTVPSELVGDLVAPLRSGAEREFTTPREPLTGGTPRLTPREQEILAMLAEGLPNKAIASRLGISDHTVKTHLEAVFEKLGASTRAEAVARAVRAGMLLL
jgi:DNA-binding NarL/FixJ family response regulator